MKITQRALDTITVRTRNRIALEMNCSVATVDRWMRENEPNSDLTKARVIDIIQEETGLSDTEILSDSEVEA